MTEPHTSAYTAYTSPASLKQRAATFIFLEVSTSSTVIRTDVERWVPGVCCTDSEAIDRNTVPRVLPCPHTEGCPIVLIPQAAAPAVATAERASEDGAGGMPIVARLVTGRGGSSS